MKQSTGKSLSPFDVVLQEQQKQMMTKKPTLGGALPVSLDHQKFKLQQVSNNSNNQIHRNSNNLIGQIQKLQIVSLACLFGMPLGFYFCFPRAVRCATKLGFGSACRCCAGLDGLLSWVRVTQTRSI